MGNDELGEGYWAQPWRDDNPLKDCDWLVWVPGPVPLRPTLGDMNKGMKYSYKAPR